MPKKELDSWLLVADKEIKSSKLFKEISLFLKNFRLLLYNNLLTKDWFEKTNHFYRIFNYFDSYEELLKKDHIYCMASGQKEDVSKFYFYAEQRLRSNSATRLFMVECSVTMKTKHIAFVFKTESSGDKNPLLYIESFISIVRNRIKSIIVD